MSRSVTNEKIDSIWMKAVQESLNGYRNLIDRSVQQLSDEQLFRSPAEGINSVAVILRHLGGNLQSRWTEFLTTDGEKATRDRDREFEAWEGSRESLLAYFDAGWQCLRKTLDELAPADFQKQVTIRGEVHTVPDAIQRSVTHLAYHVGQILVVSRLVFGNDQQWQWLSIAPGQSQAHNQATWGTAASRAAMGKPEA